MAMSEISHSKDLPLSANVRDITVRHFFLDLTLNMRQQVFEGSVTLWCKPVSGKYCNKNSTCSDALNLQGKSYNIGLTSNSEIADNASNFTASESETLTCRLHQKCYRVDKTQSKAKDFQCTEKNASPKDFMESDVYSSAVEVCSAGQTSQICILHSKEMKEAALSSSEVTGDCRLNSTEQSRYHDDGISSSPHLVYVDNEKDENKLTQDYFCCDVEHIYLSSGPEKTNCFDTNLELEILGPSVGVDMPNSAKCSVDDHPFMMVLDCHMINIFKVEGIYLTAKEELDFDENPTMFYSEDLYHKTHFSQRVVHSMEFLTKEHCVYIFMKGVYSVAEFPQSVKIFYSTRPDGPSLKWTRDQNGSPCVFTIGHFLSNRSLFPSQDVPCALFTWQASVTVDNDLTVILTGDTDPHIAVKEDGKTTYSFFTAFPMPSCTFALAVGQWQMETLCYPPIYLSEVGNRPSLRLFFPPNLKNKCCPILGLYIPKCMLEVQKMLGDYRLRRLDILVVPSCFDSLGMASPSLLFLSQSLLNIDMCARVAHEISHTWFGIMMGPLDWTEEWMTEGFCTYLEDILHSVVLQMGNEMEEYIDLRAQLNHRVLKAELENTDESLQSLRPNKGKCDEGFDGNAVFVKNGLNPEKKFMQVHYLKGYFLLRYLEKKVGRRRFLLFLKEFVNKHFGQLVTSQVFLQLFLTTFPELSCQLSVDSINDEWLDCPGLPKGLVIEALLGTGSNTLISQVKQQLDVIRKACRRKRKCGQPRDAELQQMTASQVVLLLECLLEEVRLPGHVLDLLKRVHAKHFDNAEVCHRWCELVVKHKQKKYYTDLENFLLSHQAMGVYLYGEAMISQCPDAILVTRSCFRRLQHDMPESVRETVSAMLYAT